MSDENEIVQAKDSEGLLSSITCALSASKADGKVIPSYYDLIYQCNDDPMGSVDKIASLLVEHAAYKWGLLPSGSTCTIPTIVDDIWLHGVSASPSDEIVTKWNCTKISPDHSQNECCSVVYAPMTFDVLGNYDPTNLLAYVAGRLDSDELSSSLQGVRTAYIGSEVESLPESGKNNINPPAVSGVNKGDQAPQQDGGITAVGGLVMAALLGAFIGVLFVLYRRRQLRRKSKDVNMALSRSEDCDDVERPEIQVHVLSDGLEMNKHQLHTSQSHTTDSFDRQANDDEEDISPHSNTGKRNYTFDLGRSMKADVMGTYGNGYQQQYWQGPTSMSVVPPYPMMEETSDSEVDSWAQTDGTVGSLEERLEEITAEI